ncbi:MAG: phytanoyl-CoA dioxygenase family protein [Pseudomonadota bacterium]
MLDYASLNAQYAHDGYLVVEGMFSGDQLERLRAVTTGFVAEAAADALEDARFDIFTGNDGGRELRRIVDPEAVSVAYDAVMRHEPLVDLVQTLLGGTVRFDHGKLNFKPPSGGAAVEWHQDWAFYPQTNDDMLAVGVMIEDCTPENGPLMVVPGSHRGPVYDHHQDGAFVGGIHADELGRVIENAVPLTAPAGSVSIHHVRMLHGSTPNRSASNRPLLLFNYVAVDAFPIFHAYDWDEFNARILRGEPTYSPRIEPVPVRVPNPTPKPKDGYSTGSLFELQQQMDGALYAEATPDADVTYQ